MVFLMLFFLISRPGSVQLVDASPEQLAKDYATIRELERHGLFELL